MADGTKELPPACSGRGPVRMVEQDRALRRATSIGKLAARLLLLLVVSGARAATGDFGFEIRIGAGEFPEIRVEAELSGVLWSGDPRRDAFTLEERGRPVECWELEILEPLIVVVVLPSATAPGPTRGSFRDLLAVLPRGVMTELIGRDRERPVSLARGRDPEELDAAVARYHGPESSHLLEVLSYAIGRAGAGRARRRQVFVAGPDLARARSGEPASFDARVRSIREAAVAVGASLWILGPMGTRTGAARGSPLAAITGEGILEAPSRSELAALVGPEGPKLTAIFRYRTPDPEADGSARMVTVNVEIDDARGIGAYDYRAPAAPAPRPVAPIPDVDWAPGGRRRSVEEWLGH